MRLYEEIVNILNETGNPLTISQIASEVNQRKYFQKKNGSLVSPWHVHRRTKRYSDLFLRNKSFVGLTNRDENLLNLKTSDQLFQLLTLKTNTKKSSTNLRNITVTKKDFLINNGFIKIGTLSHLLNNNLPIIKALNSCGVYAITIPPNYRLGFIPPSETLKRGNVISPWSIEKLQSKWVKDVDIVYYGLAGIKSPRTLRARLNDLLQHGRGNTTDKAPHKGGEILWQLKGYENFHLWILPTENPPVPRETEYSLLFNFNKQTGKLPFANKQF